MTDATFPATPPAPRRALWWRTAFIIYGVLMLAFGVAALLAPLLATLAASISFGALLLASGVVGLAMLVVDWKTEAFLWRLAWSAVAIIAGLCILIHPWPGALTLTLVLGASLIVQGLIAVGHAIAHRKHKTCPWGQMSLAGVLSILLGGLLVWALPHAGLIVPGVFLAVHLITFGLSLIALAFSKREATL
ncbi:MAG: hypothetical protein BroJett013_25130 [Alphaproteobacteria bacterium]|nr:MAG: hypothetical protein BroJett013_25130 [Alphaproteobacteria bacterium]